MSRSSLIFGLALGACWLALGATQASASHVGCGDTITADTTLDSDLVNCPNNGIVIGADDITLDLNGHTVDGDDELVDPCPVDEPCDFGILNDGHNGVTIKGGAVRQFGTGVLAFGVRHARISGLIASRNMFNGIFVGDSARSEVKRSRFSANGLTTDSPAVFIFRSNHILVKRTTLHASGEHGLLFVKSDHNRIVRNRSSRNLRLGLAIEAGDDNLIARNHVVHNRGGIALLGNGNVIRRNRVRDARVCGNGCGDGISLESGDHNLVAHNRVRAAEKAGILVGFEAVKDNVLRSNHVHNADRDGILIDSIAKNTLLRHNHAGDAGGDGIDVQSATTKLTRNHAVQNGDLGIEAVRGVTDRGGNRAHGNGDPRQCTNVVCK